VSLSKVRKSPILLKGSSSLKARKSPKLAKGRELPNAKQC
jgi:hypothetical protein